MNKGNMIKQLKGQCPIHSDCEYNCQHRPNEGIQVNTSQPTLKEKKVEVISICTKEGCKGWPKEHTHTPPKSKYKGEWEKRLTDRWNLWWGLAPEGSLKQKKGADVLEFWLNEIKDEKESTASQIIEVLEGMKKVEGTGGDGIQRIGIIGFNKALDSAKQLIISKFNLE